MISNGALSDSFRASNTFSSLSVNGRRLSRSSLMGMTTEIHGCDEGVMRNWNARGRVGHSTQGVLEIQTDTLTRAAVDMRCKGWIVRVENDRPGLIVVGDIGQSDSKTHFLLSIGQYREAHCAHEAHLVHLLPRMDLHAIPAWFPSALWGRKFEVSCFILKRDVHAILSYPVLRVDA